ncbi:MAG: A/G-specific adenine glycosylase [Candidatus Nanopelagicales bacterium]
MEQSWGGVQTVIDWYLVHQRDLPWRAPERTAWGVLVSEVMLQQTPVARVVPAWQAWMARWPEPAALARDAPGEAVRQWDRLGYPRRALNLHAAAVAIADRHAGQVPSAEVDLRALPGVGEYTAAAVRAFAFGRRAVVLDTNVRRVLGRALAGAEHPAPRLGAAERARADSITPNADAPAALWSVAVMELGALICTARNPRCPACPVQDSCAWLRAGRPAYSGPARRVQRFAGTDRQVRGRLLAVVRSAPGAVPRGALDVVWSDEIQRERALDALVADGLLVALADDLFRLPTGLEARTERDREGRGA